MSINTAFDTLMQAITEQNNQLRKENLEMKDMLTGVQGGSSSIVLGGSGDAHVKEQLRVKDDIIANLKKEIHELKLQRADAAKNMEEIQKQVKDLKIIRQTGVGNDQPTKQPISLSLKFDDLSSMDKADRL